MVLEIQRKGDRNYRLDHGNLGDVHKVTYAEGKILEMGVETDDPLVLDDTCKVEVNGGVYELPLFYHCRKGFYDEETATKRENEALQRAAWGFRKGQKVKVMFYSGEPVYVMGHADHQPRVCQDIFQMKMKAYRKDDYHYQGFRCSSAGVYGEFDENPLKEPDGKSMRLPHKCYRLFGYREFSWGTIVGFYGDWLLKMGPAMFIFQIKSLGLPGPITGEMLIWAALYSEALEEKTIATGKVKESMLPTGLWSPYPFPFDEITYTGFTKQSDFTRLMQDKYYLWCSIASPRWVYTEFWRKAWPEDEVAA